MDWFRSKQAKDLAAKQLDQRLRELSGKYDELDSAIRKLQLEWIETYDKIRHQLSRMARRGDLPPPGGNGEIVDSGAAGEPQMDPISAKIHARRSRSFLKGD